MYDPDLHIFATDDDLLCCHGLQRMWHTARREFTQPVYTPDERTEGPWFGVSSIAFDPESGNYTMWYLTSIKGRNVIRAAVSADCTHWDSAGDAFREENALPFAHIVSLGKVGKHVDPWFRDAKFAGVMHANGDVTPSDPAGIYAVRCMDGTHLQVRLPAVIPHKGDRMSMVYDDAADDYVFVTRPYYGHVPGILPESGPEADGIKHRMARMWRSEDLVEWKDCGIVLRYDERDPPDVQIYGMQPFRYGKVFLGLVETYHRATERVDMQLACSRDGVHWQRTPNREVFLPAGGEGAWDSHVVYFSANEPILRNGRVLIPYAGSSIKHSRGDDIERPRLPEGLGLASIRKDGWVSLESGSAEGVLMTARLPLAKPMKLDLNVDCYSGYVAVDVIPDEIGKEFDPIPGYDAGASRAAHMDSTCHRVHWGQRDVVMPNEAPSCFLRVKMKQASLFSFRWSEAG